jgi:hypothetical protein
MAGRRYVITVTGRGVGAGSLASVGGIWVVLMVLLLSLSAHLYWVCLSLTTRYLNLCKDSIYRVMLIGIDFTSLIR